jgi:hypothetical protein
VTSLNSGFSGVIKGITIMFQWEIHLGIGGIKDGTIMFPLGFNPSILTEPY